MQLVGVLEIKSFEKIKEFLNDEHVGRISSIDVNGFPQIIPMNFVFLNNAIYMHSHVKGEKLDNISRNEKVGFEADRELEFLPSYFEDPHNAALADTLYISVVIKGIGSFVSDRNEKTLALNGLMQKYQPEGNYDPYELPFWGANFWNDWERDVHFSFYEPNGDLGVALDAGVKIFGAWSRSNDQRSLSIFARGRYGFSDIEYPIFPQLDYDKFEAIVLRSSGNDWMRTNIKDVIATSLMDGSGLETQAYRPSIVYLNGEYWGLYNIREKVNEHFLDDKINVTRNGA